jgi:transcriptional regulator with XRE-family HTH domain
MTNANTFASKSPIVQEISQRIVAERNRLGLNQSDFAWAGSVKRGSQVGYEGGNRTPSAEYLAGIAAIGADVQYIVTGARSRNLEAVTDPSLRAELDSDYLVDQEHKVDQLLLAEIIAAVDEVVASRILSARWGSKTKSQVVATLYKNYSAAKEKPRRDDPVLKSMIEVLLGDGWG